MFGRGKQDSIALEHDLVAGSLSGIYGRNRKGCCLDKGKKQWPEMRWVDERPALPHKLASWDSCALYLDPPNALYFMTKKNVLTDLHGGSKSVNFLILSKVFSIRPIWTT